MVEMKGKCKEQQQIAEEQREQCSTLPNERS